MIQSNLVLNYVYFEEFSILKRNDRYSQLIIGFPLKWPDHDFVITIICTVQEASSNDMHLKMKDGEDDLGTYSNTKATGLE